MNVSQPSGHRESLQEWTFVDPVVVENSLENVQIEGEEKYPASSNARIVAKHLGVKEGLIFLAGSHSMTWEDSDQEAYFRQKRYFYYLSGINHPDCYVTYDIARDCLCAWIPPQRQGRSVIYNGFAPTKAEIRQISDIRYVAESTCLEQYLDCFIADMSSSARIYLLHRSAKPPSMMCDEDEDIRTAPTSRFDATNLQPAIDAARVIKSAYEISATRKACTISRDGHINVLRGLKTYKNEAEIEATFAGTCIAQQAKHQAYGIIAGSGENASTLHYGANNEPLKGRQLVCLDAGSEWKEYASDVTRTFPISGQWTPEAKAVYGLVAKMQDECIAMLKPGINYRDVHMHAHGVATQGLMDLGLLQNATFEQLFIAGASLAFFPHGLGHYMGLEVHDVGVQGSRLFKFHTKTIDWTLAYQAMVRTIADKINAADEKFLQEYHSTNPKLLEPYFNTDNFDPPLLEPNMIITVEPGIYFNRYALEEVWLKDPKFAKFINKDLLEKYYLVGGVRIEDDIFITEDGYENLTKDIPKGDEALKIINEGGQEKRKRGWFS